MGKMNLLKANWEGKVGETVGAKWKDKKTIRTFTKPSNPNTAEQQRVRGVFGSITSFVALFSDQIKYLSALDTSGMSVRNAIIKLNKAQIEAGVFDKATLLVSKGGLQKINTFAASATDGVISGTWVKPTATNFTDDAVLVMIAVQQESGLVDVVSASATKQSVSGSIVFSAGDVDVYAYYIDYRGSNQVASVSEYAKVTVA